MSHHLATPLAAQTGQLYTDDMYVFPGADSTVFIMTVNSTVTGEHAEPSFLPGARYEFKIHFDGRDREELTYRLTFGDAGPQGEQPLTLHSVAGDDATSDTADGDQIFQGSTKQELHAGGVTLWAGRIQDSFYIDLSLLGLVNGAVRSGTKLDLSTWQPQNAKNSFADTTVDAIVLEVSHQHPRLRPGTRIGVWCATKIAEVPGEWHQINRFGHPMMWPIFWPDDVKFDHPANKRHPSEDYAADGKYIGGLIASTVAATGSAADPDGYGDTVARELFPDVMSYVVGTPATYGFAARNGRPLADNAPEAMLSLVTNTAVPSGLTPSVSADLRDAKFPYVVPA